MGLSYFLPLHLIEGKIEGVIAQKLRKSWLAKLKQSFHVLRTLTIMLRELGPAAQSVVVWGINYVVTRALCITRSLINLGISSCIYILIFIAWSEKKDSHVHLRSKIPSNGIFHPWGWLIKTFPLARSIFSFQVEIILLLSKPKVSSV